MARSGFSAAVKLLEKAFIKAKEPLATEIYTFLKLLPKTLFRNLKQPIMKVITVSRTFPAYHPKAGQPTFFVEKIWKSAALLNSPSPFQIYSDALPIELHNYTRNHFLPKHHTIRSGHRFKTGEMASLRVWSAKPYQSKQITFAEVKVACFDLKIDGNLDFYINGELFAYSSSTELLQKFASNDGLELSELFDWFKIHPKMDKKTKTFEGQIICWNPEITY